MAIEELQAVVATSTHPLARLRNTEIDAARRLLEAEGLVGPTTRFALLALEEPDKAEVLRFSPGVDFDRRVRAVLLDIDTGRSHDVLVSLTAGKVVETRELDPLVDGQPPILLEEFVAVDEIVKEDEGWRAAMERRGITDFSLVCPCPLSAGAFDIPGEEGRRMLRVLSFLQHRPSDHPWAHPIDGIVAYVDLTRREVVELIDGALLPVPEEEANHDDAAYVGPQRSTLKPIEIMQPDGASFDVTNDVVTWENWTFRVGFEPREGLVLHQVSIRDGERDRPVLYRASIAEMVVPYADPAPVRFWQNYFDAGEYLLGQQVNSLRQGCDCLGEIYYFDAVLADGNGEPRDVPRAICLHEEDFGVLWKHTDLFTESEETRRQRRLVISFWATVGNYDYGFYWYFYLDGKIELEVKASGFVFTSSYAKDGQWATQIAPGLGAPFHQHLFSARLDMMVDGLSNAVDEVDLRRVPVGPQNVYGNAFGLQKTRLSRESEATRTAHPTAGRTWRISNSEKFNRLGDPVAYVLKPQGHPTLLADETSSIARRAAFATQHLWVTQYDPRERYPAGDFINQHPGAAGLPRWISADRDIDGQDIVLWHTFGVTHIPRSEDWPVLPVDAAGFSLVPQGFFDRNPTLDVPPTSAAHCHSEVNSQQSTVNGQ